MSCIKIDNEIVRKIGIFAVTTLAVLSLLTNIGLSVAHELHLENTDENAHCDVCLAQVVVASAISAEIFSDIDRPVSCDIGITKFSESLLTTGENKTHCSRGPPSSLFLS